MSRKESSLESSKELHYRKSSSNRFNKNLSRGQVDGYISSQALLSDCPGSQTDIVTIINLNLILLKPQEHCIL